MTENTPVRSRSQDDHLNHIPVHVVWELTLACNLKCKHCGSRAGKIRPDELSTEDCLEIVEGLARLGTREVTLIGGEAFLKSDWTRIIRALRDHDIYCGLQTGGWAFNAKRLEAALDAGLQGLGVSIDGLAELHDNVRGVKGSFDMALDVLKRARAAGLNGSVNTQIGPATIPQLRELMYTIVAAGAEQWQLQLTVAMGNAVDNDELLLQPHQLDTLFPLLAELFDEGNEMGLTMVIGNNIGYFGPYEYKLRNITGVNIHWTGCSAGQTVIGIEADGAVKGCPSLPTNGYTGGNVKDLSIEEIWTKSPEIHFGRLRSRDSLWGFCKTCYYADVCKAGCTWTSHSLLGRPGNNPYCHYRVSELKKDGLRERIQKVEEAGCGSFDIGRFELILEEIPADPSQAKGRQISTSEDQIHDLLVKPISGMEGEKSPEFGKVPDLMEQCRSCNQFLLHNEKDCPHCGADTEIAKTDYEISLEKRKEAINLLEKVFSEFPIEEMGMDDE